MLYDYACIVAVWILTIWLTIVLYQTVLICHMALIKHKLTWILIPFLWIGFPFCVIIGNAILRFAFS